MGKQTVLTLKAKFYPHDKYQLNIHENVNSLRVAMEVFGFSGNCYKCEFDPCSLSLSPIDRDFALMRRLA